MLSLKVIGCIMGKQERMIPYGKFPIVPSIRESRRAAEQALDGADRLSAAARQQALLRDRAFAAESERQGLVGAPEGAGSRRADPARCVPGDSGENRVFLN